MADISIQNIPDDNTPTAPFKFLYVDDTGGTPVARLLTGTSAAAAIGALLKTGDTGAVDLSTVSSVVLPAASAATHASRITAYNASTGQIQRDGQEEGDTGSRDMSATAGAKISTVFTASLSRSGQYCTLQFDAQVGGVNLTSADDLLSSLPVGFRHFSGNNRIVGQNFTTLTPFLAYLNSFGVFRPMSTITAGHRVTCTTTYRTDDAWPTSLPGTQITAPATLS